VVFYVVAFFFFGLTALALSNLQAVQQKMPPEETVRLTNRRWLPILLGVVGGTVLAATGIATLFSPQLFGSLARMLDSAARLVGVGLSYLLMPLGYLAAILVYIARFIIAWIRHGQPLEPLPKPELFQPQEIPQIGEGGGIPDVAVVALKWALFALLATLVITLLARAISRLGTARASADIEEVHESVWSWAGFRADLRLLFSLLGRRFRPKRKPPEQRSRGPRWLARDDQGTLSIREIYQRLLWEASRLGMARRRHETPYEYTGRLAQALPEGSQPLGELTEIYIGVRYGDLEAEAAQVSRANRLWRALKPKLSRFI